MVDVSIPGTEIGTQLFAHPHTHTYTQHALNKFSPLSHDSVMQLFLFDVCMISAGPLAALTVVTAENGGQLLFGHPCWRQGDGAFLCQSPTVLQEHRGDRQTETLGTAFSDFTGLSCSTEKWLMFPIRHALVEVSILFRLIKHILNGLQSYSLCVFAFAFM